MSEGIQIAERGIQDISSAQEVVRDKDAHLAGTETAIDYNVGQNAEKVLPLLMVMAKNSPAPLEQARKLCPAIGRMSIENAAATLQDGDLAARLGQRGREKRQAESAKASESKGRPQSPIDSKKLQEKSALQVESQPEPPVGLRNAEPSKDIAREVLIADAHYSFITQQEVSEAAITRKTEEDVRRHTEEAIIAAAVSPEASEATVQTIEPETIIVADKAAFINLDKTAREQRIDDISREAVLSSVDKPLHENSNAQPEPKHDPLSLTEVAKPTEMSESLMEYGLLEEDDVILLMAGLERSATEIEENGELSFVEIIADTADTEVFKFTPAEIQTVASVPELPAPVKEIEIAITKLAESLELKETRESPGIHQILEEIMTLPEALEASTVEAEGAVEEKLRVLFVRLFEETGTMYTPELIKSFVKLTRAHYLDELLLRVVIETEDDPGAMPDEIGTREFLQKLQHGLSAMKQAVTHFYEIGKSVLRLYGLARVVPESTV